MRQPGSGTSSALIKSRSHAWRDPPGIRACATNAPQPPHPDGFDGHKLALSCGNAVRIVPHWVHQQLMSWANTKPDVAVPEPLRSGPPSHVLTVLVDARPRNGVPQPRQLFATAREPGPTDNRKAPRRDQAAAGTAFYPQQMRARLIRLPAERLPGVGTGRGLVGREDRAERPVGRCCHPKRRRRRGGRNSPLLRRRRRAGH